MSQSRDMRPAVSHESSQPLLSVNGVSKSYRGRRVLVEVTLEVQRGQVVALIGENGTGKTTLLKICAGLIPPDSGEVIRRGRVGYCPQTPGLMELLTADEHLQLFDRAPAMKNVDGLFQGREILGRLGFPLDASRKVVKTLSGGTGQKVNLAIAMLGEADILLLDEPYQGFDQGTYVNFWDFADDWRQRGRAVIVVTHLLNELDRVDQVVELRSEKMVLGPHGGSR